MDQPIPFKGGLSLYPVLVKDYYTFYSSFGCLTLDKTVKNKLNDKGEVVKDKFGKIEKEEVSLEEKTEYLENYATTHKHFSFRSLLEAQSSKVEVIVTFLAILELMKTGKILISQEHIFDDILIESRIAA